MQSLRTYIQVSEKLELAMCILYVCIIGRENCESGPTLTEFLCDMNRKVDARNLCLISYRKTGMKLTMPDSAGQAIYDLVDIIVWLY